MATTSGTLTSKVSSTVSSPTVHYSAAHTTTRSSDTSSAISVKLNFAAWLNASQSKLGTGVKLTIYARINGGTWRSVVIKSTSASWSGTTKHSASLTLTANTTASTARIDWYVSRTGSTYSGTAGTLGSAASPKSYTITVPAYSTGGTTEPIEPDDPDDPDPPTDEKYVYVNVGGTWKKGVLYINVGETWKKAIAVYVNVSGTWKLN